MNKKTKKKNVKNIILISFLLILLVGCVVGYEIYKSYIPERVYFKEIENKIYIGESLEIKAIITPEVKNPKLTYSSSDENIAIIDQNGNLVSKSVGRVEITAEHEFSGKKAWTTVEVMEAVVELSLPQEEMTLCKGETVTLTPSVSTLGKADINLIYTSSDENVCEVDSNGNLTAKGVGDAIVTVTDEKSGSFVQMKITVISLLEDIEFSQSSGEIKVGETLQTNLIFNPSDASDKEIEYSVFPNDIATVDENGKITALSGGTAVVTALHKSTQKQALFQLTVYEEVTEIKLDKSSLTLIEGEKSQVSAEIFSTYAKNKTINWSTSNNSVAVVSSAQGNSTNIIGVSPGTCKIYARSQENPNVVAEISVTIKEDETNKIKNVTYINGILVVNKTYGVPKNYNSGGGLTKETQEAFNKMKNDAKKDGVNLTIASGYRSYDYQKSLFEKYLSRPGQTKEYVETYSARPGYSEHQTGLAIDVCMASSAFLGTPEQKWLEANCVKYGFVIRYPKGKEDKTGFMYEPWHIRYLGVETAQKLDQTGLCLEEYLGITSVYED